jgi:hypothetical protein
MPPRRQGERDVARVAHAAVGPDVRAELGGGLRGLQHGGELGRPTAVIMRVVHIAPGPTPTLRIDAPAPTRSCTPSAVTMLPAAIGMPRPSPDTVCRARSMPSWWPCAVSTTSTSTPAAASAFAFAATSPLMPTAAATIRRPFASTAGR